MISFGCHWPKLPFPALAGEKRAPDPAKIRRLYLTPTNYLVVTMGTAALAVAVCVAGGVV